MQLQMEATYPGEKIVGSDDALHDRVDEVEPPIRPSIRDQGEGSYQVAPAARASSVSRS